MFARHLSAFGQTQFTMLVLVMILDLYMQCDCFCPAVVSFVSFVVYFCLFSKQCIDSCHAQTRSRFESLTLHQLIRGVEETFGLPYVYCELMNNAVWPWLSRVFIIKLNITVMHKQESYWSYILQQIIFTKCDQLRQGVGKVLIPRVFIFFTPTRNCHCN